MGRKFLLVASLIACLSQLSSTEIKDIQIKGLARFSKETILTYAAVEIGDELDKDEVSQIISNLYITNFFDDVQVELSDTGILSLTIKEKPVISSIKCQGNKTLKDTEIDKALTENNLVKGRLYSQRALNGLVRDLMSFYHHEGYYNAQVSPIISDQKNGSLSILIDIKEGPSAKIREINFHGNQNITSLELMKCMEIQTSSLMTIVTNADKYSPYKLQNDLQKLKNYYQNNGYPFATITDQRVTLTEDKKNLIIDIFIDEGLVATLNAIDIAGIDKFTGTLPESPKLPQRYDHMIVQEYERKLRDSLLEGGFAYNKINYDILPIDNDKSQVNILFKVQTGKQFKIRKYTFSGNFQTRDKIIRNQIRRPEGAFYSVNDMDELKKALMRTGYFDMVDIQIAPVDDQHLDVNINVNENLTKKFHASGGIANFGSKLSLMWSMGVEDRNFLGTGTTVNVDIEKDYHEKNYLISFSNPYLTNKNIEFMYRLEKIQRNYKNQFMATNQRRNILSNTLGCGWSISAHTRTSFNINYTIENVPKNQDAFYQTYGSGMHFVLIGGQIQRNMFNRFRLSDEGYKWTLSSSISTPLGDFTYADVGGILQKFTPVYEGFDVYQYVSVRYMFPYTSSSKAHIPPSRLLSCGGAEDIRGYYFYSIGPEVNGKVVGGNLKFIFRNELMIPNKLLKIDYDQIRFSLFLDAAQMWRLHDIPSDPTYSASKGLKFTTGIATRWTSPFLPPISLSVNKQIAPSAQDKEKYEWLSFSSMIEF